MTIFFVVASWYKKSYHLLLPDCPGLPIAWVVKLGSLRLVACKIASDSPELVGVDFFSCVIPGLIWGSTLLLWMLNICLSDLLELYPLDDGKFCVFRNSSSKTILDRWLCGDAEGSEDWLSPSPLSGLRKPSDFRISSTRFCEKFASASWYIVCVSAIVVTWRSNSLVARGLISGRCLNFSHLHWKTRKLMGMVDVIWLHSNTSFQSSLWPRIAWSFD